VGAAGHLLGIVSYLLAALIALWDLGQRGLRTLIAWLG
jgi:hypothetical protein